MIKRILLGFLFFVLLWEFVARVVPFDYSQHQWHDNLVKAEAYIFEGDDVNTVFLGSSLSCRFNGNIDNRRMNLSMGGQSVLDGISILGYGKELPDTILIETNYLLRSENREFQSLVGSPFLSTAKRWIKGMRASKMPLVFFNKTLFLPAVHRVYLTLRDIFESFITIDTVTQIEPEGPKENPRYLRSKEKYRKEFNKRLQLGKHKVQYQAMQDFITTSRGKGKVIYFYEVPTEESHMNLPYKNDMRKLISDSFKQIPVVPLPEKLSDFHTTDGLHLNGKTSGVKFLNHLTNYINQ